MEKYLGKFSPNIYALLRIVAGFCFAMHGAQKLLGWPGDKEPVDIGSMMGVAGIVELVGGILIMIGLVASYAAFISSGQMAVAYFMVHLPQDWNPLVNGGELALIYCFLFLYIASRGAGIWSVDGERQRTAPSL